MNTNRTGSANGTTRCARCGAPFHCGALGGDTGCWCQSLPALPPLPGLDGCLCPACMQARVDATAAAVQPDGPVT